MVGYAYATAFNERPAYRWSASVSVYVAGEARASGVGRALYEARIARQRERGLRMASAGNTLPNAASDVDQSPGADAHANCYDSSQGHEHRQTTHRDDEVEDPLDL